MRLTQIKLSGFKSFVDPTNFHIPGQLVGVVGPNGCGKSNIIDAARWVLGESKASELRGESMQDVIFNGSGNRKPAGRASVELVFDNPDGRAGGQWSQYAEIAVKRVLTRDGNSSYSINNQVVRRRDVQDIFLGTGLGPRAYAIIGQGMISRIIEAKPEELRVFLEEAAGVSKYKERRRETENRLNDTRENLTRVDDILRELSANLEKLEGQARVAQHYHALQTEHAFKETLLWVLRRTDAQAEQARHARAIEEAQLRLDGRMAELRRIEAELEEVRALHFAAGDAVHARQAELFEAGAAVNQLESEIRFVVESRKRLENQIGQLTGQRQHWQGQVEDGQTDLARARAALEDARLGVVAARAAVEEQTGALPEAQARERSLQEALAESRAAVTEVQQALQLEAAQQRNAQRNLEQITQRRTRLDEERRGLAEPNLARIEALQVEWGDGRARLAALNEELAAAESRLPALTEERGQAHAVATRESTQLGQTEARLAALVQLQHSVQTHDKLQPWLERHELARLPRLWQRLHVEPGWETALESVLRERIAALEVGQLELTRGFFGDAPPAKLTFFGGLSAPSTAPVPGLVPLAARLQLDDAALRSLLSDWLANVYVAESPEDAFARRAELPAGASFVVRAGHRIGRNSVRFYASDSEQSGMLARQQEIEHLRKQVKAEGLIASEARTRAVQLDAALSAATATQGQLRATVQSLTHAMHERELELQRLEQQRVQVHARAERIATETADLDRAEEHERALCAGSQQRFEALDRELAQLQAHHEERQLALEAASQALEEARAALRRAEHHAQERQFAERNAHERITTLSGNIELAAAEVARLDTALAAARLDYEALSDAAAQAGLQEALRNHVAREEDLRRARSELDGLGNALREADDRRLKTERELEPLRVRITESQLKEQAARLNQEQFALQLEEAKADVAALEAELATPEGARYKPQSLQLELNRLSESIAALGAVNLAALDELASARDRKTFLDSQSSDLNEAITTLEDAIRKIDRETRHLLQETFDAVNRHFGELFPALFGGGEARLVMTGEEILDAGVQVMAQPPGKKNSTIHLLSGGEKALAATALVFSMFQLNPAPFCLLDEVDAPLDDANTERFCNLVRKMSTHTQFLFISHNKIAMEMAHQLIGVTMQEQGVSRIVAVDMDAAVELTREPMEKVA